MKAIGQFVAAYSVVVFAMMFSASGATALCWSDYQNGEPLQACQGLCDWAMANHATYIARLWGFCEFPSRFSKCASGKLRNDEDGTNCCPVGRPTTITSCQASLDPNRPGGCVMMVCGPQIGHRRVRRTSSSKLNTNRYITPAPLIRPPRPGLLEGGGGFGQQSPGAAGKSMAPNLTRGGNANGGGLR